MRVVAYTKYDREAASTRYRVMQYRPALAAAGIELEYRPLLPDAYVRNLATSEGFSKAAVLRNYVRRFWQLTLDRPRCDLIWVYAELLPFLPASLERRIFSSGVPVVYDWDDAIFIPYVDHRNPVVRKLLGAKFETLLRDAAAVTCGNAYLRDYCASFCPNSMVVPTVVDTELYRPRESACGEGLVLGWIGSPSTWANVRPLLPLIRSFCERHDARFRVVGAGGAAHGDVWDRMDLIGWCEDEEIAEVQRFDIGIMPLEDAPFQRGKSGFKLVQYMACGVASIASPVGVNCDILGDGMAGILARSNDEWAAALDRLAGDPAERKRLGAAGRERAVTSYSLQSQAPRLVALFRELTRQN